MQFEFAFVQEQSSIVVQQMKVSGLKRHANSVYMAIYCDCALCCRFAHTGSHGLVNVFYCGNVTVLEAA